MSDFPFTNIKLLNLLGKKTTMAVAASTVAQEGSEQRKLQRFIEAIAIDFTLFANF